MGEWINMNKDGWMNKYEWGWVKELMNDWMKGWMNEWMNEWMNKWMMNIYLGKMILDNHSVNLLSSILTALALPRIALSLGL